jgi:hypothetical protein
VRSVNPDLPAVVADVVERMMHRALTAVTSSLTLCSPTSRAR